MRPGLEKYLLKNNPGLREKMVLQSKCAIVPGKMYDFSKAHILSSVDGILKRLGTDYLDVLVLHRPDALGEPEEVAEAFDQLTAQGKVRYFGVSNHNPGQILLLKRYVKQEILSGSASVWPGSWGHGQPGDGG